MINLHSIQGNLPKMDRFMKSTLWIHLRGGARVRYVNGGFEAYNAYRQDWRPLYVSTYYYRSWLTHGKPDLTHKIER